MLRPHRSKLIVVALASLGALGGGVAVAASTNALPFAADHGQTTAATAAPSTSNAPHSPSAPVPAPEPNASNGNGPDATGPAKYGLCTAYAAGQGTMNGNKADSTAYQALAAAAGGANNIAAFCAGATPGGNGSPPGAGPTQAGNGQGADHANPASDAQGPPADPGSNGQSHRP